ncbi:MAG: hypothetical protein L0Z50_24720, partial [Verrucomicrobiales bacterium]|nr:hypothetical protein [Verrucomicrobiales bacterium]
TLSFKAAVFSAIFAVLAGICAGVWAVVVWRREAIWRREDHEAELHQRDQELQWKQAELARQLLDDIFDHRPSEDAWDMVDGETEFKDLDGKNLEISKADIKRALKLTIVAGKPVLLDGANEEEQREEKYVRYCFDALFYYLERLERSLTIKVVRFDDLVAPTGYYITLMSDDKSLFEEYSRFIGFDGAIAFMNRFPEWRNART